MLNRSINLVHRLSQEFKQNSQAWELAPRPALVLFLIPAAIMLGMTATVRVRRLFVWLTAEDSVIEWAQFLLLFISALLFIRLGVRLLQLGQWIGILCLFITLGVLFVAGEEISWGQRIFGWSTPEALEAVNAQQETTLHNIYSAHKAFIYGVMLAGLYGALMPLLASMVWNNKRQSLLSYLLIPPLCLVPAFFMPFGYRFSRLVLGVDDLFPHLIFPITKFSEVTELCMYFGLVVFAWLNLRKVQVIEPPRVRHFFSENELNR